VFVEWNIVVVSSLWPLYTGANIRKEIKPEMKRQFEFATIT
jgi:hypothetical protein